MCKETDFNTISGGVCAAQGFRAAGLHVGVKTHAVWKKDVALIVSDVDCAAAAVFTKNVVKAAPIHIDRRHLVDGKARAVVANSGNANAATGEQGIANAKKVETELEKLLGLGEDEVFVSSTGVIGQQLPWKSCWPACLRRPGLTSLSPHRSRTSVRSFPAKETSSVSATRWAWKGKTWACKRSTPSGRAELF